MRSARDNPLIQAIQPLPQPNYVPLLQAMVEGLQDHVVRLEQENRRLKEENAVLRGRVEELKAGLGGAAASPSPPVPPFVKPAVVKKKHPGKPGRRPGHPAALRPPPEKIDFTVVVPLAGEWGGACQCPDCQGELADFQDHERLVEDIVPAKVVTTCYKTRSGYCKRCRRRVESRAPEQPPAGFKGEQKHAQLGLNALAWAAVLRVENRLPMGQVAAVVGQAGLDVCEGALSEQAQRLAGWLEGEYEHVKRSLRASDVVYCDETGARIEGGNAYLWGLCNDSHTLYHFDPTRARKVVRGLLGATFGGHLVSDYYSVYTNLPYKQQKCLVHLLRELRDTAKANPAFAAGSFRRRLRRVLKEMLLLKGMKRPDGAKGRPKGVLPMAEYARRRERLSRRLLAAGEAGAASGDADEKRIGKRVLDFHPQLLAFLSHDKVQGTNNPAERAMIHAVVARKISGGHRSWPGARAWAVLASITRTARKQGRDVLETVKQLLMDAWAGRPPGLLTPATATAATGPSP